MLQKVSLFSEPFKITIGKHWFIVSGVAVSKQLYFFYVRVLIYGFFVFFYLTVIKRARVNLLINFPEIYLT